MRNLPQLVLGIAIPAFLLVNTATSFAEEPVKEEKEAMEVGGLMTVDMGGPVKEWDNFPLELGWLELSALLHLSDEINGTITLLTESDPNQISIYRALGSWEHGQTTVVFGKQIYNLGLLTTRIISNPDMIDVVQYNHVGLSASEKFGAITAGAGLTVIDPDSANHDGAGLIYSDITPMEGLLLRLSAMGNPKKMIGDLALNWDLKRFAIDAEGYFIPQDYDDLQKGGFYAGIAFKVTDNFQIASRYEGWSSDDLKTWSPHYSVGFSHTLFNAVYYAAEYSYNDESENMIALQIGLQSTLKLPGFQPHNLTRE